MPFGVKAFSEGLSDRKSALARAEMQHEMRSANKA